MPSQPVGSPTLLVSTLLRNFAAYAAALAGYTAAIIAVLQTPALITSSYLVGACTARVRQGGSCSSSRAIFATVGPA